MADYSLKALIQRLFSREGGYSNQTADKGGETQYGISRTSFPGLWADGVVTLPEAEGAYETVFYTSPGIDQIPDPHLREQMFDFGVNAGPKQAILLLQIIVGTVPDGKLGPQTLEKLTQYPAGELYGSPLPPMTNLNLAYESARVAYYAKLAKKDPSQLAFLSGWIARAMSLRKV